MKILYVVAVLMFVAIQPSQAQNNFLLIGDTNTVWIQSTHCFWGGEGCIYVDDYSFSVNGTVMQNGLEYYRIKREWHQTAIPSSPTDGCDEINYSSTTPYFMGVREDSGKVYVIGLGGGERLLYDFTAQLGDSIPDPTLVGEYHEIMAIDSILVGNDYRTRWITYSGLGYIEGIGGEQGLLHPLTSTFECGYSFDCYSESSGVLYPLEDPGNQCGANIGHLGVEDHDFSQFLQLYYQNDGVTVQWKGSMPSSGYVLHNLSGQEVDRGMMNTEVRFSNTNIPAGIYILRIIVGNQHVVKRIVLR